MPCGPVPGRRRFTGAFFLAMGLKALFSRTPAFWTVSGQASFGDAQQPLPSSFRRVLRGFCSLGPYLGKRCLGMPRSPYLAIFVVFCEGFEH